MVHGLRVSLRFLLFHREDETGAEGREEPKLARNQRTSQANAQEETLLLHRLDSEENIPGEVPLHKML